MTSPDGRTNLSGSVWVAPLGSQPASGPKGSQRDRDNIFRMQAATS